MDRGLEGRFSYDQRKTVTKSGKEAREDTSKELRTASSSQSQLENIDEIRPKDGRDLVPNAAQMLNSRLAASVANPVQSLQTADGPAIAPSPSPVAAVQVTYAVRSLGVAAGNIMWQPSGGKFMDKTLQQVVDEVPKPQNAPEPMSLRFRLGLLNGDGGGAADWTVQRADELGFTVVKRELNHRIKALLAGIKVRPLNLQMKIDVIYSKAVNIDPVIDIADREELIDW
jgi:hypothetical protein